MRRNTTFGRAAALGALCALLAAGCGSGRIGATDGAVDGTFPDLVEGAEQLDLAFDNPDLLPDWWDGLESCDAAAKWCVGNERFWCDSHGIYHLACETGTFCKDGVCIAQVCEPGETECTADGRIRTCLDDGSGFGDPEECPEGLKCDEGACAPVICTPGDSRCVDTDTESECNATGTRWVDADCGVSYVCAGDRCTLQICPAGMSQCVDESSYHVCNDDGTGYEAPQACVSGTHCWEGTCKTLCQLAELDRSSVGCKFYAVDQRNRYDSATYYLVVGNTNDSQTAAVKVEHRRGGAWSTIASGNVPPNSLQTFSNSTMNNAQVSSTTAKGAGYAFRVTSDIPIVAYQLNAIASCTGEGSMLIPVNALDRSYYVLSYRGFSGPPLMTIIGTQDGTSVTVTPSQATAGGTGIPAMTAGVPTTITGVNEDDVIQIVAGSVAGDLTGTRIEATAPVAVYTGTYCSHVPQDCTWCHRNDCLSCDPLEEALIPKTAWGHKYIASITPEYNHTYFRVVAEQAATTVTLTLGTGTTVRYPAGVTSPFTLAALQMQQFELARSGSNGHALVEADKPILVYAYIEGGACRTTMGMGDEVVCKDKDHCPGNYADPSMITVVPVEQFLREYIFLTPSGFTNNYVTVIRATGAALTLDAAAVTATFTPVGTSGYEVAHLPVAVGSHHILSGSPFGIISVGYGYANSYGYPGGMNLAIINP